MRHFLICSTAGSDNVLAHHLKKEEIIITVVSFFFFLKHSQIIIWTGMQKSQQLAFGNVTYSLDWKHFGCNQLFLFTSITRINVLWEKKQPFVCSGTYSLGANWP